MKRLKFKTLFLTITILLAVFHMPITAFADEIAWEYLDFMVYADACAGGSCQGDSDFLHSSSTIFSGYAAGDETRLYANAGASAGISQEDGHFFLGTNLTASNINSYPDPYHSTSATAAAGFFGSFIPTDPYLDLNYSAHMNGYLYNFPLDLLYPSSASHFTLYFGKNEDIAHGIFTEIDLISNGTGSIRISTPVGDAFSLWITSSGMECNPYCSLTPEAELRTDPGWFNYKESDIGFNMTSVAPEPISSILFITGGTILAGRNYLKRKKKI